MQKRSSHGVKKRHVATYFPFTSEFKHQPDWFISACTVELNDVWMCQLGMKVCAKKSKGIIQL